MYFYHLIHGEKVQENSWTCHLHVFMSFLIYHNRVTFFYLLFGVFSFHFWQLATYFCTHTSLSDLPTMEKPRSHTSSQAQWKPSDMLHYFVLVPIKADTTCCQEHGDTLQKGNPPLLHCRCPGGLFVSGYISCCYKKIYTVRWLNLCACHLWVWIMCFRAKWETQIFKAT